MLKPNEIRARLSDCNLVIVSKKAYINYTSLYRFMRGQDSKVSLVEKLSDYLEAKEHGK